MSLTGVLGQTHNLQRPEEEDDECEVLLRRMPMKHELSHGAETLIDSPYLQELVPIDRDASTSDMSIAAIRGSVDRAQSPSSRQNSRPGEEGFIKDGHFKRPRHERATIISYQNGIQRFLWLLHLEARLAEARRVNAVVEVHLGTFMERGEEEEEDEEEEERPTQRANTRLKQTIHREVRLRRPLQNLPSTKKAS